MTLAAFQQALGAMIADRALSRAVRDDAVAALGAYDLSPREAGRLAAMAGSPGMVASCTLHRLNRLTPLHRFLPRTLALLGSALPPLVEGYWRAHPETRLQFEEEVTRFAAFVEARVAAGAALGPAAVDMLRAEVAACRFMFGDGKAAEVRHAERPALS